MKKMYIMGALALIMLLALPGAVSAAETDTVTVSGSIGGYIDVSVTDENLSLGTMVVGTPATSSTGLSVDSSFANWGVDVTTTNSGYMTVGALTLDNLFEFSNDAFGSNTFTVSQTDFLTGTAGLDTNAIVSVRQSITNEDAEGTYSITLTFTGASN